MLCEIEATINSRPLVYSSEDDLCEPLTPFHLMFGRDITKQIHVAPNSMDISGEDMTNRTRYQIDIMKMYWKRFSTTYLNELRQFHMYSRQKSKADIQLYQGDVVLIKDDNPQPRNNWRKGIIDDVILGRDNQPRGVKLYVISKTGRRRACYRPLQKIIPFEISNQCERVDRETPVGTDVVSG